MILQIFPLVIGDLFFLLATLSVYKWPRHFFYVSFYLITDDPETFFYLTFCLITYDLKAFSTHHLVWDMYKRYGKIFVVLSINLSIEFFSPALFDCRYIGSYFFPLCKLHNEHKGLNQLFPYIILSSVGYLLFLLVYSIATAINEKYIQYCI